MRGAGRLAGEGCGWWFAGGWLENGRDRLSREYGETAALAQKTQS